MGPSFIKERMNQFEKPRDYLHLKINQIKGLAGVFPKGTFYYSILIDLKQFKNMKDDKDFV